MYGLGDCENIKMEANSQDQLARRCARHERSEMETMHGRSELTTMARRCSWRWPFGDWDMAGALSRRWLDGARDGVSPAISMWPDDAVVGRRSRDSRTMVPMAGFHLTTGPAKPPGSGTGIPVRFEQKPVGTGRIQIWIQKTQFNRFVPVYWLVKSVYRPVW